MRKILSHAEYYGFLAEIIKPPIPVSIDRIKASQDPHLNDIALASWDRLHGIITARALASKAMVIAHGSNTWSLSDSVCVAKAYAKRLTQNDERKAI